MSAAPAALLAATALLAGAVSAAAQSDGAATKISITYEEVRIPADGSPPQRLPRSRQYILKGGKTLMVRAEEIGGPDFHQTELGRASYGNGFKVTYNIVAGNIVVTTERDTFKVVRTVGTNGKDKCWMRMNFIKSGGDFVLDGHRYKDLRAENAVCRIETLR